MDTGGALWRGLAYAHQCRHSPLASGGFGGTGTLWASPKDFFFLFLFASEAGKQEKVNVHGGGVAGRGPATCYFFRWVLAASPPAPSEKEDSREPDGPCSPNVDACEPSGISEKVSFNGACPRQTRPRECVQRSLSEPK